MLKVLALCVVLASGSVVRGNSTQLSREEVEQILFDFRQGAAYKMKEANIERLAKTGEAYVPVLIECLQWPLPPWLAERIEKSYERHGDKVKIPLTSDGGVQVYVQTTLIRIGVPAVPPLIASLKNQPETVATVARILGSIGDVRAVPPLVEILRDSSQNYWNRCGAAYALQSLDAQEAVPCLIDVLAEQPDNWHSSDKLLDAVATALAELTDRSFGFTLIVYKPDMTWDMTPRYTFVCGPAARENAIAQWRQWWNYRGELRGQVNAYLAAYAERLKHRSVQDAKTMRSDDYVRRIKGTKGRLILIDNPDGEWFDALERPKSSVDGCKDYRISLLDCRDEGERVIVRTRDTAVLMVDGREDSFAVTVDRVLDKQGDSLAMSEESLLKWEPPVFGP